ncbi:MAG: hypothetical protein V1921_01625 [Candidatus Altiarchaeota archaeon]
MKRGLTILAVMALVIGQYSVSANSIGAGPATIIFRDMMAGQTWDETITVSNGGHETLKTSISVSGLPDGWITLEPEDGQTDVSKEFTLSSNEPLRIKANLDLPEGVEAGVYQGTVVIKSKPAEASGSGIVMGVGVSLSLDVIVNVTNVPKREAKGLYIVAYNGKKDDTILLECTFENTGNVDIMPELQYNLQDRNGDSIGSGTIAFTLPRARGSQTFKNQIIVNSSKTGEYMIDVRAYLDNKTIYVESKYFNIYEVTTLGTTMPTTVISVPTTSILPPTPTAGWGRGYLVYAGILAIVLVVVYALSKRKK